MARNGRRIFRLLIFGRVGLNHGVFPRYARAHSVGGSRRAFVNCRRVEFRQRLWAMQEVFVSAVVYPGTSNLAISVQYDLLFDA